MMRLFFLLLVFLFTPLPAAAADLWSEACEEESPFLHIVTFESVFSDTGAIDEAPARLNAAKYAPCIDKVIAEAEKWSWRFRHLRQPYMDELVRMQDWLHNDLDKVHELSRFYKARNRDAVDQHLALLLQQWGVEKKHPPAEFYNVQSMFESGSTSYVTIGRLRVIAVRGYVPAMQDMARRSFHGDGTVMDRGGLGTG